MKGPELVALGALALLVLSGGAAATTIELGAGRVRNRHRAAGVRRELLELLDAWEALGTHDVEVAPAGGLRTDALAQLKRAADGASNAPTLRSTPHGRGGALDVWPLGFAAHVHGTWAQVPQLLKDRFATFGAFAEARGFTWGGRWRSERFPNGDQPHVELAAWAALPYPPPPGGYA